uniref:Arrestin-like N-terminal domain-containing protein n=1 Tax=Cyclopterus lumpus TaxID=8103 RepID=A0A8C2WBA7_CYCLU
MMLNSIKYFKLELDGPADAAFTGGEVVSGQVVLELRRDTRVQSMKVQGRGVATAHWLENRGMNSVYNDYTSKITYFRKRQHLIRGKSGPICAYKSFSFICRLPLSKF